MSLKKTKQNNKKTKIKSSKTKKTKKRVIPKLLKKRPKIAMPIFNSQDKNNTILKAINESPNSTIIESPIINTRVKQLKEQLLQLLYAAIEVHHHAKKALANKDKKIAFSVIKQDSAIDIQYNELLQESIFLLTQQPLAKELRRVIGYIQIGRDVEVIADCAVRIAKFIIVNDRKISSSSQLRISTVQNLLFDSLQKLIKIIKDGNVKKTLQLAQSDEIINEKILKIAKDIIKSIARKNSIQLIDERVFVFKVIDALELAADQIVKICETLVYIKSGFLHGLD